VATYPGDRQGDVSKLHNHRGDFETWFKVTTSTVDSASTETHWLRRRRTDLGDTRKRYIESSKNSEKNHYKS